MKKLVFIIQSKGGAGKSVLTFLLVEKHLEARVLEMDDATKTTSIQLRYRKPLLISFLNENRIIDRGLFDSFLEKIETSKNELFICDLGASISEQLPYYLSDVQEVIPAALQEMNIELQLYVVIGGSNIFIQTMQYLDDVRKAANGSYQIKVFANQFYRFTPEQQDQLDQYIQDHKLTVIPFDISADKNLARQDRIKEVLKSGNGISQLGPIQKSYFKQAIEQIPPIK